MADILDTRRVRITGIGLLLLAALLLATAGFRPARAQDTVSDPAALQAQFGQREAEYQAQIAQLQQAYAERQAAYRQQIEEMTQRLTLANNQLQTLASQEQALQQQVVQLQAARSQRGAQLQAQLEEARNQYAARAATINAQLAEVQARLAEANAILGR